jgi:hypothetical protein
MNHPFSSCHSHLQEVADLADELQRFRNQPVQNERDGDGKPIDLEPEMDVDEVMEQDDSGGNDWNMDGGLIVEEYEGAAKQYGTGTTFMREFDGDQYAGERVENLYYPFASRDEWELAAFLLRSDLSMASIDLLLSLNLVSVAYYNYPYTQLLILNTGKRPKTIVQHSKEAARTC